MAKVPSLLPLLTLEEELLAGAASAARGCSVGSTGCSWPRLVQVTSFPCCLSTCGRAGMHRPKTLPDFTRRLLVSKAVRRDTHLAGDQSQQNAR